MNRMTTVFVCLLVFLVAGDCVHAVTMEHYLDMVRERHPFFAKEAMRADIAAAQRDRTLGDQDWVVRSSPFLAYTEPVENSVFAPERIYALGLGGTAEKTLWSNGARLSVGWRSDYSDQNIPGITIPGPGGGFEVPTASSRFYENRLFASYTLPLIRNKGGALDRLPYELASFGVDMARVAAVENQENFLLDVAQRFLDWVLIGEQMRIDQARLSFAEEQRDQARRKRQLNLVDEVDVLRAEDAVQVAQERLALDRSRFRSRQSALSVLASDDELYEDRPEFALDQTDSLPDLGAAVARLTNQRILRQLRLRHQQLDSERRGLEGLTKPEVGLVLGGALQNGDADFIDAWGLTKPDVSVSLSFTQSLGSRTARSDVARLGLEMRQLEQEMEVTRVDLEAELRRVWIEIHELVDILELNRQQIETARRKTEEERRLYNQGRVELTFVIQSRDAEALAELTYATNAISYHRLFLAWRALTDELLASSD